MNGDGFRADFEDLTGQGPMAWQGRLYRQLAAGEMPGQIDIATGLGKTMVIVLKLG